MATDREEPTGFWMQKIYPVDWPTAVAELYFDDLVWAYVGLDGIDESASGEDRVNAARVVVEFWREPSKPTGDWDLNLDLAGALEQLEEARKWLFENEVGRAASGPGSTSADEAFRKMSEATQESWLRRGPD